ncbi:MAG: PorV/PorQ family protein [Fidelibacterota bacterium]|nr:MAG: PorV/PorQ family protein [Candidatus Neomarinimicrobiota bacterium]
MKPIMRPILQTVVVFIIIAGMTPCLGQGYKKLGVAGMKFLDIDANVRSAAMGGASSGLLDGAASMFQNPAGLVDIAGFGFSAGSNNWIADINQHCLGAAINLNKVGLGLIGGVLGASLRYMDNGDMIRTDYMHGEEGSYYEYPDPYRIEEWAAGLAYARRITDNFLFGGHVKYVVQDFGTVMVYDDIAQDTIPAANRLTPLALDVGTIFYTGVGDLRIAMVYRNFAEEVIYVRDKFELPIALQIGATMTVFRSGSGSHSLLMAADLTHPRDYAERINLGFEYRFGGFALRAGYKYDLRFQRGHDEEGLSAGIGLNLGSLLRLDYAYTMFGVFGSVQRFSIAFSS